jgi:tetratricopeptide (TPR) repeat protein
MALMFNPILPEGRWKLGRVYASQGDYAEAVRQYEAEIPVNPASAILHYDLGIALRLAGRHHQAVGAYRKAITLDGTLKESEGQGGPPGREARWVIIPSPEEIAALGGGAAPVRLLPDRRRIQRRGGFFWSARPGAVKNDRRRSPDRRVMELVMDGCFSLVIGAVATSG